jgi:hypothetical protein
VNDLDPLGPEFDPIEAFAGHVWDMVNELLRSRPQRNTAPHIRVEARAASKRPSRVAEEAGLKDAGG